MNGNIILCGLPGTGKTETGKRLAVKLGWQFIDTDALLENIYEQESGKRRTCRQIYAELGEDAFRLLESSALASLRNVTASVISIGGGTLSVPANLALLKRIGRFLYLVNDREIIFQRLMQKGTPAYLDSDDPYRSFQTLASEREKIYSSSADIQFHTGSLAPDEIAEQILALPQFRNNKKD